AEVSLSGPLTVRLLPKPYIDVGGVSVGGGAFVAKGARLELSAPALLGGQWVVTRAEFERPILTLVQASSGAVTVPALPDPGRRVALDAVTIRDGAIEVVDSYGDPVGGAAGIDAIASADALRGPWTANGDFASAGGRVAFEFSSGVAGGGAFPVKLALTPPGSGVSRIAFDGDLFYSAATVGRIEGALDAAGETAPLDGVPAMRWQASAKVVGGAKALAFTGLAARIGEGPLALTLTGDGVATLAPAPSLRATLAAKRADFDALLRAAKSDRVAPARVVALALDALDAGAPRGAFDLRVGIDDALVGGEAASGLSARLVSTPGARPKFAFAARMPGGASLSLDGAVIDGAAPAFDGALDFSAGDAAHFLGWAGQGAPAGDLAALQRLAPFREVAAKGDVRLSRGGLSSTAMALTLDGSRLAGALDFTRAVGAAPARLYADLTSDSLDLARLPDLTGAGDALRSLDADVTVDAKAARVADVGGGALSTGRVALAFTRAGGAFQLKRLDVSGLDGATLSAHGAWDASGPSFAGSLDAADLAGVAALAARVAPGAVARFVADHAADLSPAKLAFAWSRAAGGAAATLTGTLSGAKVEAHLKPSTGAEVVLAAALDAPDARPWLKLAGVAAHAATGALPARLTLDGHGKPGGDSFAHAALTLAGADLDYAGLVALGAPAPGRPSLEGTVSAKTPDAGPLAAALGLASPAHAPLLLAMHVGDEAGTWRLGAIKLALGAIHATGDLTYAPSASGVDVAKLDETIGAARALVGDPKAPWQGHVAFDRVDLAELATLVWGAWPAAPAGA
ncbi:MAG: hypothetical protein KGQ28_09785, partial [Hyphomicrobiales bacterium]|nr:hypothetical protein [Hyphomicrobiales bacterium]